MVSRESRQSGFNIVEAVVVVAAIGIIGAAGWFVYQHDRAQLTGASSNGQPTQQTTTQNSQTNTPTTATLDIKEWGVHMTLDSTTASMYYYIKPNLPGVAYISLQTISGIAPACAADKTSLGAIVRSGQAQPGTTQVGSFWYSFSPAPAACIDNDTQNAAVQHALPHYSAQDLITTFNTLTAD